MDQNQGLFITLASVLLAVGILMVHSASITSWPTEFEQVYLSRHLTFLLLGIMAATVCACLPARFWFHVGPYLFVLTVVLLILVLVPGVGTRVNGAQRWLRYGPLSLQPSELAKISLPLFLCRLMGRHREHLHHLFAGTLPVVFPAVVVVPLVLVQPDLGTSLFLAGVYAITLFVGGWPIRNFIVAVAVAIPAILAAITLKPYQMSRLSGFLAAWSDWTAAPYQLKQSLISFGAGGLWGVGLGKGWQKLSFQKKLKSFQALE